jgi:hypothetical protein
MSGAVVEPAIRETAQAERAPEAPARTPDLRPEAASAPATPVIPPTPGAKSGPRPEPVQTVNSGQVPAALPDPIPVEVKDARPEPLPAAVVEPPKPTFEEVIVKEDSVIGIRLDSAISTDTAKLEDAVTAHVARDVTVGGHTAIPAGARLEGSVSVVERGGKFKDRSRIGIQFHSLVLADGSRTRIQTEPIFREGENPTAPAAAKVGASAVVGSILGAVIGGKKGAAIGATTGAAAGGAAVVATTKTELVIPAGTTLTVRMTAPVTLSIERDQDHR